MTRLVNKPELRITERAENGSPVAGECSTCGTTAHFQVGGISDENERKLNEAFHQHVRDKHPRTEDFSQAAARSSKRLPRTSNGSVLRVR
jgi:hypothetical protein